MTYRRMLKAVSLMYLNMAIDSWNI